MTALLVLLAPAAQAADPPDASIVLEYVQRVMEGETLQEALADRRAQDPVRSVRCAETYAWDGKRVANITLRCAFEDWSWATPGPDFAAWRDEELTHSLSYVSCYAHHVMGLRNTPLEAWTRRLIASNMDRAVADMSRIGGTSPPACAALHSAALLEVPDQGAIEIADRQVRVVKLESAEFPPEL